MKWAHRAVIGAAVLLGIITAASSASPAPPPLLARSHSVEPGGAQLMAFGGRSFAQLHGTAAKLDAALADLSRHAALARPGHAARGLARHEPGCAFHPVGTARRWWPIDAVTRGDPQQDSALRSSRSDSSTRRSTRNDVGGWLPVTQIEPPPRRAANCSPSARRDAAHPRRVSGHPGRLSRSGSQALRTTYPDAHGHRRHRRGALRQLRLLRRVCRAAADGVPVSGYRGLCLQRLYRRLRQRTCRRARCRRRRQCARGACHCPVPSSAGDCLDYGAPAQPPFSDEGRAMLQIVHAVAPGASLAFYTADDSEADFANGIAALAAAGAKVIADDVGYFDEPFFQDGIVAQAIDTVEAKGVAYFSAAGNDSDSVLREHGAELRHDSSTSGRNAGEHLLNFDTSGATNTTSLPVTVPAIPPGDFLAVVVEWDQPYVTGAPGSPGATSEYRSVRHGRRPAATRSPTYDGNAASCTGPNALGSRPVPDPDHRQPGERHRQYAAQQNLNIIVGLASNATARSSRPRSSSPSRTTAWAARSPTFATNSATMQGHPGAAGAAAVGAAFYFDTPRCGTIAGAARAYSPRGRCTHPLRYVRRAARDAGRAPEAGLRRSRRRQQYVPRIHPGIGRIYGAERDSSKYHDQRMPE